MPWLQSVWLWALRTLRCPHTTLPLDPWGAPSLCQVATGRDTATEGTPESNKVESGRVRAAKSQASRGRVHVRVLHVCPDGSTWWQPAGSSWAPACPGPHGAVHTVSWWSLPGWASAARSWEGPSNQRASETLGCCQKGWCPGKISFFVNTNDVDGSY